MVTGSERLGPIKLSSPKVQKTKNKLFGFEMSGTCSTDGGKGMVGKPEGRRPLGRRRRVDNIRMDSVEAEWGDEDWIGLAQDRDR
jgi:hypothetical protein